METLLIQINDPEAYKLLKKLEQRQLIRVMKKNSPTEGRLSEKYAGKLSKETADRLQKRVSKSREEWQNRTI
jgi:hypothetical protein